MTEERRWAADAWCIEVDGDVEAILVYGPSTSRGLTSTQAYEDGVERAQRDCEADEDVCMVRCRVAYGSAVSGGVEVLETFERRPVES